MFAADGGKMLLGYLETAFSMMSHGPCRDCEVTLNINIKYYIVMNITKINVQNKYLFSDIDIKILSILFIEVFSCDSKLTTSVVCLYCSTCVRTCVNKT